MSSLGLPDVSVAPLILLVTLTGSVLLVVLGVLRNEAARREIEETRADSRRMLAETEIHEREGEDLKRLLKESLDRRDKAMATESALRKRLTRGRLDRLELVHELGRPEAGMGLFRTELAPTPALQLLAPKDVVFSREIWSYRNVAEVWAESEGDAAYLLEAAFPLRGAVAVTKINAVQEPRPGTEGGMR